MTFVTLVVTAAVALATDVRPGRPLEALEELPLRSHAELEAEIERLAAAHPQLCSRVRVALSREGRSIEALRLRSGDVEATRPGILVVANLEGPRVFESALALRLAQELMAGAGDEGAARELLESTEVWIVPRANPDAAEGRFASPRIERWSSSVDVDNDRDGRLGEDPWSDVNGDGVVAWLRAEDPDGEWMEDPTDARVLVKAERSKGERGRFALYREGRDLDGDEAVAEDPAGDARVDRNFSSGWEAHTASAGLFPSDEPEVRGLMEFVMARPNLALVLVYGGRDNLVEKPKSVKDDAPAVKRVPPPGLLASDAALLEEIGRRFRETTENEATGDGGDDAGTFARWCYDHRGILTAELALWDMPSEALVEEPAEAEEPQEAEAVGEPDPPTEGAEGQPGESAEAEPEPQGRKEEPKPSADAEHLLWVDSAAGEEWRFLPWTAFDHPELGPVEIGGFAPFAKIEPPAAEWDELASQQFEFLVALAEVVPQPVIESCESEQVSDGLWKVKATLRNDGLLPLLNRSARRTRTVRPGCVRLRLPEGATLLAGKPQELVRELDGSGHRVELEWLVLAPADAELGVTFDSDFTGERFERAEVKQ